MNITVKSTDAYLFARLATELQMMGIETTEWNDEYNPFNEYGDISHLVVYEHNVFGFHNHPGVGGGARLALTDHNYSETILLIEKLKK